VRVAVTGSSGWVGSCVLRELMSHGHEAIAIDIRSPQEGICEFRHADILDIAQLESAVIGCEAVIHLAAVPDPGIVSPEELFKVNVLGTMHALEAATRAGVRRFVSASSDAAIGFSFRVTQLRPDYFPIDEQHRAEPQDEYGLAKVLMEEMCRSYASRGALETVALRTCWVWDKSLGEIEKLSDPSGTESMLWMYVHVLDTARAYRLACEAPGIKNATIWIAAKDCFSAYPTGELINRFYPGVPIVGPIDEYGSTVNCALAQELLGWAADYSWRDLVSEDEAPHKLRF